MSSGKRQSVIICGVSEYQEVSFDPIDYYRPDSLYVFVHDRKTDDNIDIEYVGPGETDTGYRPKDVHIEKCDTHDFEYMMSKMSEIIGELKEQYNDLLDIYINITSGTHEFAAAGVLSAMTNNDIAVAFRVDVEKDPKGRCIVSDPIKVTSLNNSVPDKEMIVFLDILDSRLKECRTVCFREIIRDLKESGQWSYDPKRKSNYGKDTLEHKEITYLSRHYIKYALDCGWITRPSKYRIQMTAAGRSVLNVHSERAFAVCSIRCNEMISDEAVRVEQENEVFDILDDDMRKSIPYRIDGRNCIIRYE